MVLALPGRNREERQENMIVSKSSVRWGKERQTKKQRGAAMRGGGEHGRWVSNEDQEANGALMGDTEPPGGQGGQVHPKSSWLWT